MNRLTILIIIMISTPFFSCTANKEHADAYGTFETTETLVAAKGNGTLESFKVEEGQKLTAGIMVGCIDTTDLHIKAGQIEAQIAALHNSLPESAIQLQVIQQELSHAKHEQQRVAGLIQGQAATQQQKDNIDANVRLLQKKYASLQSTLSVQTASILGKIAPLQWQLRQIAVDIDRNKIISPLNGVVLTKFVESNEVVSYGKPLFSLGNLDQMILRAYVSGDQLSQIALGDTVQIATDGAKGQYDHWKGIITWIADKAEFTPKQIQTKDLRADLVYAVKIRVANQKGKLKIGMPGEVVF